MVFFLNSAYLFSINNDTSKVVERGSATKWFTENQFEFPDSTTDLTSSLTDFHKYISKNTLGNAGLAEQNPAYRPSREQIGFKYSTNHYSNYYYHPYDLRFYNTRVPYTDLFYVIGTKREQLFKGTFSYNLKKNWNIAADFCRIRSEGSHLRQNTNDNFIALSTNYRSKNNRYWLLSSVIYNSVKNSENGGIADDSVFENIDLNEKLLLVNLTSAKRSQENANIYLKQIFNFGKRSTDTSSLNSIIPSSRLILTSSFDANSLQYEDKLPTSGYYPAIYYDSTITNDSTFFSKIKNELTWKRLDNKKHRGVIDLIGIGFNFKQEQIKVHQRSLENTFNNYITGGEIYNTYTARSIWWNLSMNYVLRGYNQDDHWASLYFKQNIRDSITSIAFSVESRLQKPDFIYNRFLSNSFQWDTSYSKTVTEGAEISFVSKKFKLEANLSYYRYKNVLYFDSTASPKQFNGSIPLLSAFLKKDLTFYNWHFDNKITYQYLADSSVIRVPEFITENSIYYENNLLKNALRLQIGASLYFLTSYYSNAYMPATEEFYLQDNKKYGNYPFIDFFVNAKIKTVRIFFKIDHLNSGWSGKKYVLTPGYPYPERTFKLGISWRFFD
jgi:hypothetical protein